MVTGASNTWTSWTNGFASENNANLHRNETADRILIGASGAYSTTGTWTATGTAVQVIANFKVAGSSPSPSSWIHPVNQPIRRTKRQQPQYYGQFWSQDREFIVPTLDAWARTVNQPIRKSKRQQPGPNQKPFVPTVTPIVPTGWPEPIVQPRIVRKRQQPQYYGQFWAQDKVFIIPTLEAWVQPTNQPLRSRIRRPQQPQCYGTFWAQNQEFIVPGLESWMRPTNQPVRGRRRLQVVKVGVFTATLTVAPVVPFGWQEPTTQPRIVKKRQQPQYGKPAPLRTGESPLISLWKHETNQPIKSRTPKRQQPQGYGNPFYDIPKQAVPVLNAWVQPVNQPQRRTYVKRQQPQVFVGGWQKASNTLAANNKTSVIFLTDGRIAVRLSKNIYMPL
jgi:hypothetical protein